MACVLQLILAQLLDIDDPFLVEEYTYSHILESVAEPKGYVPIGVPMDRDGILPDALRQACGGTRSIHARYVVGAQLDCPAMFAHSQAWSAQPS